MESIHLKQMIFRLKLIIGGIILVFGLSQCAIIHILKHNRKVKHMEVKIRELKQLDYYNKLSGVIADHYNLNGNRIKVKDVKNILIAIDEIVPLYFPDDSPFSRDDFLSFAAVESIYNPKAVGKCGEVGVYQIWKWKHELKKIGKEGKDPFDIKINTEMAAWLLKYKYGILNDWKNTVIAYNGSKKYWNEFLIAKNRVKKWKELVKKS